MRVEYGEVTGSDRLAESDEALVLERGTHRVDALAFRADAVERGLDAFGRRPFATLLVCMEPVLQTLTPVSETARLGLVDLLGRGIMQNKFAAMPFDQIPDVFVAHHDDVASFAILYILWQPCIAEGDVGGFGEHVVAVVTGVVFEVTESPVGSGQFRGGFDYWWLPVRAVRLDGVVAGRGAGSLMAEVDASDPVEWHAGLPGLRFGEEVGFQVSADQSHTVADPLVQCLVFMAKQSHGFDEAWDADEQVTSLMFTHVGECLAHFDRIVFGFRAGFQFVSRVGDLVGVHMVGVGTVFSMDDRVDHAFLEHGCGDPTDESSRAAARTPAVCSHVADIGVQKPSEIWVMLHAVLPPEQLSSQIILIGYRGKRARVTDQLPIPWLAV